MTQPFPFNSEFIEPNETMGFSNFDLAYWKSPEKFLNLLSATPNTNSINQQIKARSNYNYRNEISSILKKQYSQFDPNSKVFDQIARIQQTNTFTIICAHQPCLMGGPLFWVYKILSTIKLCKLFSAQFPDYHFIPIYYSGNEDHDFEEINHFQIFQNRIIWNEKSGTASGRLPLDGLKLVLSELKNLFQRDEKALHFIELNVNWIEKSNDYASYFRFFVHELFGDSGLLYFNPDDHEAKSLFAPIIEKELKETFINSNTSDANAQIQNMHYPLQVNPRELNLFYHHASGRKRLIKKDGTFYLVDSQISWTEEEILEELKRDPSAFSPNVLMRPLYQEFLFPNVAFVGGGGEIAYWMQLKKCFETASIPYPLLFRRLSAFCFDQSLLSKIAKTPFVAEKYLQPLHDLEKAFIKRQTGSVDSIEVDVIAINQLLEKIRKNCEPLDTSTKSSIESELQKINKSLEHVVAKRDKVLKQKHEQDIQNIRKIKETLFPSNSIQERIQSFLPYYFKYGSDYFKMIEDSYEPTNASVALFFEKP